MTIDTLANKRRPVRILLVEDNHGDALLVKRAFEHTTIENNLTIAISGEEALKLLSLYHATDPLQLPDIIILDLNLPGINGKQVLQEIKNDKQFKMIPVIILSSSQAKDDVMSAYNNHANCYMKKAYNLEELFELTEKIAQFWFKQVILPDEENMKHNA